MGLLITAGIYQVSAFFLFSISLSTIAQRHYEVLLLNRTPIPLYDDNGYASRVVP